MNAAALNRDTHIDRARRRSGSAHLILAAATGAVASVLGCGGGDDTVTPPPVEPSRPTTIVVEPDTFFVTAGATLRLKTVVEDQHGKLVFNAALTWTSSDAGVATVDTAGVVTGVREGRATITVATGPISTSSAGTIHSQDRPTLVDLHRLADGENWANRDNWGSQEPLGSWYGVEVNEDARVTALRLSENGLGGHLTEDLGKLAFLTELHVDGNERLSGPIPVSLSETGLEQVQYGGTSLCTVRDEGFRAWLNAVPVRGGDFVACNEERSDLMKLHAAMGGENWTNSSNWGTSLPLERWYGIAVDSAGRVTEIKLNRNDLSGEIPPEIRYFPQLRLLRLDYNELEGELPGEIGELTELRRMDMDGNNFTGSIPPEIGNLVKLEELWMGGNEMSGPLPPEMGNLANLRILHLYEARFDGSIPEEFGELAELRLLRIEDTRIDGTLPATMGGLEKLNTILVAGNQLSRPPPGELGGIDSLSVLDMSDNRIEGALPPGLGGAAALRILDLSDNRLDGPLPEGLGGLVSLRVLDARDNRLPGPLPSDLGGMTNLRSLFIRNNSIDGPLPAGMGQLDSLQWISAENNLLSGPLPPEWGGMDALIRMHIHNNPHLSGPLPAELTSLEALDELIAFETGLCAPATPEIRTWLNDVVAKWRVPPCAPSVHGDAYLIQATQSMEYPVPLVAGRSALLRVFVVADEQTTETIPPVRARFFVNGAEVQTVDIPAGSSPIPTAMQEGEMELSANVEIPGEVIQPGLEMVVEVDPDATVDASLGVAKRIPAEGRAPVEVREVPPLQLTLVPFVSRADNNRDAVTFVTNATPNHDLFFETRTLLPVGAFEISKHGRVTVDSNDIFNILADMERIRTMEQGTGHWMGLIPIPAGANGVAYLGVHPNPQRGKISVSRLNVGTIAHELGHNLNLRHADCGNPAGIDQTFPYTNARTGVWGYDPRGEGSLVPPNRADLMAYCDPVWVSDYYFTNALRFRLVDPNEVRSSAAETTLLVSGGASADGTLHLDPAFLVETSPVVPHVGGPYRLAGRGADGRELFSLSFEMQLVWDGDGRSGFAFALPVQAGWEVDLESLVLIGPDGSVEMREGSEAAMAILRDPATGEVRAVMRDLPADAMAPGALAALAPEPGLEIVVSDGLPGVVAWRR